MQQGPGDQSSCSGMVGAQVSCTQMNSALVSGTQVNGTQVSGAQAPTLSTTAGCPTGSYDPSTGPKAAGEPARQPGKWAQRVSEATARAHLPGESDAPVN